jgi:plasmid stabilization system protein ParE
MRVIWSLQAQLDLDEIFAFLEYNSPRKAFETINRIVLAADALGDFPLMGSIAEDSQHKDLRSLLEKPYRIYYRAKESHVEIASVEDTRRGYQLDWLR